MRALFFLPLFLALLAMPAVRARAAGPVVASQAQVSPATLSAKIAEGIGKVDEFRRIREWADQKGLRVYAFGGTAASLAHYSKLDLAREQGDARLSPDRFHYEIGQIFLPNQDLDLVVDGTAADARALQDFVAKEMPYFMGKKERWEVTLLRKDLGDKPAKLDNPNFSNQHTDSLSVGTVELSTPKNGEPLVRDVLHWNEKEAPFLRDVANGKVSYLPNSRHEATAFFKQGRNPPLLSAVRFLIKASQFGLRVDPADLAAVKKVVAAYRSGNNSYVSYWLKKNLGKLVKNSVDLESTYKILEATGLKKLMQKPGMVDLDTEALLMLQPLPTKPLGTTGRTAAELAKKLDIKGPIPLAHDTRSMDAWYSLTRSLDGRVNALMSNRGHDGAGLYFAVGEKGAWDSAITFHAELKPEAREGVDFVVSELFNAEGKPNIVVLNREAVQLRPHAIKVDPLAYFRLQFDGDYHQKAKESGEAAFLQSEWQRMARGRLQPADYAKIDDYLTEAAKRKLPPQAQGAGILQLGEALATMPAAGDHLPKLIEELGKRRSALTVYTAIGGQPGFTGALAKRYPGFYPKLAKELAKLLQNAEPKGEVQAEYAREKIETLLKFWSRDPLAPAYSEPVIEALLDTANTKKMDTYLEYLGGNPAFAEAEAPFRERIRTFIENRARIALPFGRRRGGVRLMHLHDEERFNRWFARPEAPQESDKILRALLTEGYSQYVEQTVGNRPEFAPALARLGAERKSAALGQGCRVAFSRLLWGAPPAAALAAAGNYGYQNYEMPWEKTVESFEKARTCPEVLALLQGNARPLIREKRQKYFREEFAGRWSKLESMEGCAPLVMLVARDGPALGRLNFLNSLVGQVKSVSELREWERGLEGTGLDPTAMINYLPKKMNLDPPRSKEEEVELGVRALRNFYPQGSESQLYEKLKRVKSLLGSDPRVVLQEVRRKLQSPYPTSSTRALCAPLLRFGMQYADTREAIHLVSAARGACRGSILTKKVRRDLYESFLEKNPGEDDIDTFEQVLEDYLR